MKHTRSLQLLLAAVLCASCATAPDNSGEAKLVSSARDWLVLLDDQRYQDAWQHSAAYFKNANSQEELLRFGVGVRRPLGQSAKREVWQQSFRSQLRGRPAGQYFVVTFRTTFENASASVFEHLVLENEQQGWNVAGYAFRGATTHHFAAFDEQVGAAEIFDTVRAIQPPVLEVNR